MPIVGLQGANAQSVTLDVHYANPANGVKELHEELAQRFSKLNPDVRIRFRTPPNGYAPLTEQVLRAAVVNNAPDVVFEGLNFLRTLSERNLTVPLDSFAQNDGGFDKLGYRSWSLEPGRLGGGVRGLPFAISIPVLYINGDLVKSIGRDPADLPSTWPALVEIGKAIEAKNAGKTGFFYGPTLTGTGCSRRLCSAMAERSSTPMKPRSPLPPVPAALRSIRSSYLRVPGWRR